MLEPGSNWWGMSPVEFRAQAAEAEAAGRTWANLGAHIGRIVVEAPEEAGGLLPPLATLGLHRAASLLCVPPSQLQQWFTRFGVVLVPGRPPKGCTDDGVRVRAGMRRGDRDVLGEVKAAIARLGTTAAAEMYGVSPHTIYRWRQITRFAWTEQN